MTKDYADLIARLEAATEGTLELDAAIALELCRAGDQGGEFELPLYTTSVDAALTLVPEGWPRALHDDCGRSPAKVTIVIPDTDWLHAKGYVSGTGATLPLAICGAALRARAEK